MNEVNFFWRGSDFGFLNKIVIQSHIKVGHTPIIWLAGKKPINKNWRDIEKNVIVKDANVICNIEDFISSGGNKRTAADLWRFSFLYKIGGLYCDTDAFALKKFPDDDWIVCSAQNTSEILSIGVLRTPKGSQVFLDCIKHTRKDWYNNQVFSESYRKFFGNSKSTHDNLLFYPYKWQECNKLFSNMEIPSRAYSVHFYGKALEDFLKRSQSQNFLLSKFRRVRKISDYDEKWCKKNSETLLGRLCEWLKKS